MDSAVAGLIGAAIGASAAIAAAFVTSLLQMRQAHDIWLRDKKQEAYSNAVRYILRVLNKRSEITAEGLTVLGMDAQKEWFDDMSEALTWVTALSIYCSPNQRDQITKTLDEMRKTISQIVSRGIPRIPLKQLSTDPLDVFSSAYEIIIASERRDIGRK
jgi:hypothetical protein